MDPFPPTFPVWFDAFGNLVPIVVVQRTVVLAVMVLGFFGFVRIREFNVRAGCLCRRAAPVLASAEHPAYQKGRWPSFSVCDLKEVESSGDHSRSEKFERSGCGIVGIRYDTEGERSRPWSAAVNWLR